MMLIFYWVGVTPKSTTGAGVGFVGGVGVTLTFASAVVGVTAGAVPLGGTAEVGELTVAPVGANIFEKPPE